MDWKTTKLLIAQKEMSIIKESEMKWNTEQNKSFDFINCP